MKRQDETPQLDQQRLEAAKHNLMDWRAKSIFHQIEEDINELEITTWHDRVARIIVLSLRASRQNAMLPEVLMEVIKRANSYPIEGGKHLHTPKDTIDLIEQMMVQGIIAVDEQKRFVLQARSNTTR